VEANPRVRQLTHGQDRLQGVRATVGEKEETMKPPILLLLMLCAGCASKPVVPPKPQVTRKTLFVPARTLTMAWTHQDDPNLLYNLYSTSDWVTWHLVTTTPLKQATVPTGSVFEAFYVTATNTSTGLESISPWNP